MMFKTGDLLYATDKGFGEKYGFVQEANPRTGEITIKWHNIDRTLIYTADHFLFQAAEPGGIVKAEWKARRVGTGTRYLLSGGRVVVQRAHWLRPGFHRAPINQGSGWVILVDGKQHGLAFSTAKKAKENAELPGVWKEIQALLAA